MGKNLMEESIRNAKKDIVFWDGFDAAIDLVRNVFRQQGEYQIASCILEEIEDEADLYKNDK